MNQLKEKIRGKENGQVIIVRNVKKYIINSIEFHVTLGIYELCRMSSLKTKVYKELNFLVGEKISELKNDLQSSRESSKAETKSSMGDKHETSREMIRQEIDFITARLDEALNMEAELQKIRQDEMHEVVHLGSLVETKNGLFLISVAFGKIEAASKIVYVISSVSPAAKAMMGKRKGDDFSVNGKGNTVIAVD